MIRHFLLICICLAGFAACHEEHEMTDPSNVDPPVTPQEPQTSLIKTVTVGTETTRYTYDHKGRVADMTQVTHDDVDTYSYTYH